ncbi:MAG TPA: universal stress protein [Chloroflexota bacterium]|nr:universal stress protein [Chloroflexota bacterium]
MIERILVPLDTSRLSEAKIPYAEEQARAFGAEIILLHVLPPGSVDGDTVSPAEAQARTYLDAIAARLHAEGLRARTLIRYGDVAQTILNEITTEHIDLVVLGANIRRGLSHLLVGSVAEEVIARAPCPVLLVRPGQIPVERAHPIRSFDEDVARVGPVSPRSLGLRTVEVSRIIGSVGRAHELDGSFRPINRRREDEHRFQRIRQLMEEGAPLPPVVLYKLGYGYYVLDGNHRVAAAKQLGQLEIDALVTEFVPLRDPQAQRVFAERRAFERATGLTRIGAALPGQYPRLEELIRAFAREQGIEDLREAAQRWESEVYRPIARRIRQLRIGQRFPGERTADIFVRVATLREEARQADGHPVDWNEALARLVEAHPSIAEGTR